MTAPIPADDLTALEQIEADVDLAGEPSAAAIIQAYRVGLARGQQTMAVLLAAQHDWDEETFGPGPRTGGFIDHMLSELVEIEDLPDDLEEWIDMAILALGGAMRHGATPEQALTLYAAKMAKNMRRVWPDWHDFTPDERIEHIDQPGDDTLGSLLAA